MRRFMIEVEISGADGVSEDRVEAVLRTALEHGTAKEALGDAVFNALADEAEDVNVECLRLQAGS